MVDCDASCVFIVKIFLWVVTLLTIAGNGCLLSDLNSMPMMLMMNRVRQIMDYVLPFHQSRKTKTRTSFFVDLNEF